MQAHIAKKCFFENMCMQFAVILYLLYSGFLLGANKEDNNNNVEKIFNYEGTLIMAYIYTTNKIKRT